jgi:hypothetical protein
MGYVHARASGGVGHESSTYQLSFAWQAPWTFVSFRSRDFWFLFRVLGMEKLAVSAVIYPSLEGFIKWYIKDHQLHLVC